MAESNGTAQFGQRLPALIKYLSGILDAYPDGSQILKELLQNSEDAGAKSMKILYDANNYGTDVDKLVHPDLVSCQGPSLCVFNDAKFGEKDWFGIQHLNDSPKREDVEKIGKFGLGFNSVYHLTDTPWMLSGTRIGIFEPTEKIFSCSGSDWVLTDSQKRKEITTFSHQFEPILETIKNLHSGEINILDNLNYEHTLFRFPLRKEESFLSSTTYEDSDVRELLSSFQQEANDVLLFLTHIERVTAMTWEENERIKTAYEVEIVNQGSYRDKRQILLQDIKRVNRCRQNKERIDEVKRIMQFTIKQSSAEVSSQEEWVVVHYIPNEQTAKRSWTLASHKNVQGLPWVSVAAKVAKPATLKGRTFCFLPLPLNLENMTGLPVHLNAYFGLESNRRNLKWTASDQSKSEAAQWNEALRNEVLPRAYVHLIKYYQQNLPDDVYQLWPDSTKVHKRWKPLLKPLFQSLFKGNCIKISSPGGNWVGLGDLVYFDNLEEKLQVDDKNLANGIRWWLNLVKAPYSKVPKHVMSALIDKNYSGIPNIAYINPYFVRKEIVKSDLDWDTIDVTDRMNLLEYQVIYSENTACAAECLENLPVIPLGGGDGSFGVLSKTHDVKFLLANTEVAELLLPMKNRIVLLDHLNEKVKKFLKRLSRDAKYNVQLVDKLSFPTLLKECLPPEWSSQQRVHHNLNEDSFPNREWLNNLWKFLNENDNYKTDLTDFVGITILVLKDDNNSSTILALPKQNESMLLVASRLPPRIETLLGNAGVVLVPAELLKQHEALRKHIHEGDANSFIKLLNIFDVEKLTATLNSDEDTLRELQSFIVKNVDRLPPNSKSVLQKLPLFQVLKWPDSMPTAVNGTKVSLEYCSRCGHNYLGVRDMVDMLTVLKTDKILINCQDKKIGKLAQWFLIDFVSVNELARSVIENSDLYTQEEFSNLMPWVMKLVNIQKFKGKLKGMAFVESDNCVFHRPQDLFDPTVKKLTDLFHEESDRFPVGAFADEDVVEILRMLGLRTTTASVTCKELIETAEFIRSNNSTLTLKKSMFLDILQQKWEELRKSDFEKIKNIELFKAKERPPNDYSSNLPWFGADKGNKLYKATKLVLRASADYVGSFMPVLENQLPLELSKKLGFLQLSDIPVSGFVRQLKAIADAHSQSKLTVLELPSIEAIIYTKLYQQLWDKKHTEVKQSLEDLGFRNWIWIQDKFVSAKEVVANWNKFPNGLEPYVYRLPLRLKEPKILNFLYAMGVLERDGLDVAKHVYQKIQDKYSSACANMGDEESQDLNYVLQILNLITSKDNIDDEDDIAVPISTGGKGLRFSSAKQCFYQDGGSYNVQLEQLDYLNDKMFVHKRVPNETAVKLGAKSLINVLLGAEDFEQEQSIVGSLKDILRNYPVGSTLFCELLQNADDAKAKEMGIMLDMRDGKEWRQSVLTREMRLFQGSALWVYNDAAFTELDFTNVKNLRGATKKTESDKIGSFGIGLNCIYHVTDVPSFVSGNFWVIFDPQKFCGFGARGKKINLKAACLIPDQFKPLDGVFGCDLTPESGTGDVHYSHTLFRLPLRNSHTADKSEFGDNKVYDFPSTCHLLKLFADISNYVLLFLQHVDKLDIKFLSKTDPDPKNAKDLLSVKCTKSLIGGDTTEIKNFIEASKEAMSNSNFTPIAQTVKLLIEMTATGDAETMKITNRSETSTLWLVHWSLSDENAVKAAKSKRGRSDGLMPAVAIAVPIDELENGKYKVKFIEGSAFCYLPLPIKTGLPFHIHAAFALASNRRDIWKKSSGDVDERKAGWNAALMTENLITCLMQLLDKFKELDQNNQLDEYQYSSLWPDLNNGEFDGFGRAFYLRLCSESKLRLWKATSDDEGKWVTFSKARFLALSAWTSEFKAAAEEIVKQFVKTKQNQSRLVTLTARCEKILKTLLPASFAEQSFTDEQFFTCFFPELSAYNPELSNNILVKILLSDHLRTNPKLQNHVITNKCIPVAPSGNTRVCPRDLVLSSGDIAKLYTEDEGKFAHGIFNKREVQKELVRLGMPAKPNHEILLDRAKSVETLVKSGNMHEARKRSTIILQFLSSDEVANIPYVTYLEVPFLFSLVKPSDWPDILPWFQSSDDETVYSPRKLVSKRFRRCVGSVSPIWHAEGLDEFSEKHVMDRLKFGERLSVEQVVKQLKEIGKLTSEQSKEHCKVVTGIVLSCFDELKHKLTEAKAQKQKQDASKWQQEIIAALKELETYKVLTFVDVGTVSFKYVSMHGTACGSYLFSTRDTCYGQHSELLKLIGVKSNFCASDYIDALKRMKEDYPNKSLPENLLGVVNQICIQLRNIFQATAPELIEQYQSQVFLPDKKGMLLPSNSLFFCDLDDKEIPASLKDEKISFCNDTSITRDIAEKLGVRIHREHFVKKFYHPFGRSFGQHEDLTLRIRNILKQYNSKDQLLREMIQNADDSGATEMKFILDERKLKNDKVLSVGWKDLQGASLVVCNNRPFKKEDYDGIVNLGLGSKGEDCQSTGRFGIGFNTVYHITDAPMFLSNGEVLCIFDPHMKYSSVADTDEPGGIFDVDHVFESLYSDVMEGFRPIKDITWENSTVFRLPLRTSKLAEASKIGGEVTTTEIYNVLSNFAKNAEEYLLFLNNIERISVLHIDESGNTVYDVTFSAQLTGDKSRINKNKFVEAVTNHTNISTPVTQFYEMKIHDSRENSSSVWLISQRLGVLNECDAGKFSKLQLLPQVSIAVPLDCNYKQRFKIYVTQPFAGETSLPMHINGAFMPDEGRRQLLISGDSLEKDWNIHLLVNELAPLYVETLENLKAKTTVKWIETATETSVQDDVLKEYWKQLAMTDTQSGFVELTLMHEVYRLIHHSKRSLFFGLTQYELKTDLLWLTTTNGFIDELGGASHIRELLTKVHFPKFHTCLNQILKEIGGILDVSMPHVTPLDVCQFLKATSDALMVKDAECTLPANLETTIINENEVKNCLEYIISDTNADLENVPLLLTADGQLRRFKEDLPRHRAKFLQVLPAQSHLFTHEVMNLIKLPKRFCKKFNVQALASHLLAEMPRLKSNKPIEDESRTWNLKLQPILEFISKKFLSKKFTYSNIYIGQMETENLAPLNSWALIPAICSKKRYLVPFGMISAVVHSPLETANDSLNDILKRLGCLFTDLPIDWHLNDFLRPICASCDKPETIIEILDAIFKGKMEDSDFEVLTADDKGHLLKFIVDNQTRFTTRTDERTNCVEIIKSFPLFQTLEGRFVSLEGGTDCEYIACEKETEGAELDKLKRLKNVILLKPTSQHNRRLFEVLGIKNLTVVEMYCKFIIPCLQYISGEAVVKHFAWLLKREKSMLLDTGTNELRKLLGAVKVVEVSTGVFKAINEFYDCDVDLFKAMLAVENFIPTNFWSLIQSLDGEDEFSIRQKEWKKFFHKLGLIKKANAETFLRLATSLETWPNKEELEKNSKILVSYLMSDEKLHSDSTFLQKIATVKFIFHYPICDNLRFIYPQCDRFSNELVCYSGSVCCDLQNVCWSVASLLPSWSTEAGSKLNPAYLKWKAEPDFEDFLQHMENICNSLQKNKLMDHTVTEENINSDKQVKCQLNVLEHMLEYLRSHITNTQLRIERIQNIPCILVDKKRKMVCPKSVVREKFEECPPFLYILPDEFYPFIDLLEKLGTKREVDCHHYCSVLSELYSHCDNRQIKEPNLKKCLVTAYQGFLDQLCHLQEDGGKLTLSDLYLPDENWVMQRSTDIIVYDDQFATESIHKNKWNVQIIGQGNTPIAKYASALLSLPEKIKPTPISQFLSEELSAESERCCADDCRNERNVSRLLQNSQFVRTVVKLINLREMHFKAPADQKKMSDKFNSVVVKCYDPLIIEVLNKETFELIERKDIATHLQRTNLLISHDANNELLKQNLIDNLVELITVVCPLESAQHKAHLTAVLDKLDLENTAQSLEAIQQRDIQEPDKAFEPCLPLLGSVLQQDLVCLLDNYIYNYYKVGEYIACSLECGDTDDKTYIFAQITKECESMSIDSTTSKQYFVDIGTAKSIKKTTWEIYKFINIKKLANDSVAIFENSRGEASPICDSPEESESREDPRFTKSLQEVMDEITEQLEGLWKKLKKDRNDGIKRMYKTWHPDKNPPDKKEFCEEAFKHLKNEITRLEKGLPRKKKEEKPSEKESPRPSPEWEECFRRWNQSAEEERSNCDDYVRKARDRDEWDFSGSGRSSWVPPSFETNNVPQAKLWLRQAQYDLKSAENDLLIADYHLEWIFFKCHQIAEKSMKAIQYTTSIRCSTSRSLREIAQGISMEIDGEDSERITRAIRKMDLKGVSETQTLYPSSGLIPFNAYHERNEDCKQVVNLASELCSIASVIVNNARSRESI